MKEILFWGFILFSILVFSCDTEKNTEAPNYFVKYFGNEGDQEGVDIVVNNDGTILLFGNTTLPGDVQNKKLYLAKCDAQGNLLWERKPFGGALTNEARDIQLTSDRRIVLVATSEVSPGDNDVLLIITDQDGNELNRVTHGYLNTDEDAVSVTQTSDGFIVTGSTSNTSQKANPVANDQRDAFNFRFYNNLTLYPNTWNETLGPGTFDSGVKVIEVASNRFYFFGFTNKRPAGHSVPNFNFWIFPVNNVGNGSFDVGEEIFAGDPLVDEKLSAVALSPLQSGEGFLLTGMRIDPSGMSSIYIAKLRKNLNFSSGQTDQVFQFPSQIVPTDADLGRLTDSNTSCMASMSSGFLIISNENSTGNSNFYLTKITNTGGNAWNLPKGFIFGGGNLDRVGAVTELPDGNILIIGTFSIGDDSQQKIVLIKVDKNGKFSN
jgi:hypothetical protein